MNRKLPWPKAKYLLALGFNFILFYALAGWFIHNVHLRALMYDITQVHSSSLLVVVLLDFLGSLFYGYRLMQLLNVSFAKAWKLICIGNGLNNILPFRLGDVARVYCGRHYYQVPVNKMIAATFIERYCDLILLLLIGLIFLVCGQNHYDNSFVTLFLVLLFCALFSVFLYRRVIVTRGWLRQWLDNFPMIAMILNQLTGMLFGKTIKTVLLLSSLVWLGTIMIYYGFFSINLPNTTFNLSAATMLCFTTTLAFAIPYMVAGIGVFESAIFYYLIHFVHVPATEAVALALVFHIIFSVPQILLMCGIFAWRKINAMRPLLKWKIGHIRH